MAPADDQARSEPVLLVEDSRTVAKLIQRGIVSALGCPVKVVHSCEEASQAIDDQGPGFMAAVVDLELPDAPGGEIVDLAIGAGLPTIVLTASCDVETRERILEKDVVDYYQKDNLGLDAVNEQLLRLRSNPGTRILIVDDSSAFRKLASRLLAVHCFDVIEAGDGEAGLEALKANPDICLILVDYEMPGIDGVQMVARIRSERGRDELAIIGLSSLGSSSMSAMFLKSGADDFLAKPFQKEEFYCRIYRSIETIEHIGAIKRAAFTDQLTGLSNRLDFFDKAPLVYQEAREEGVPLVVSMIDVDHFKDINDTYGHAGGDIALQHLAELLTGTLPEVDLIARFGGEEFCVLARGLDREQAADTFERVRAVVEDSHVRIGDRSIGITLSIGVARYPCDSLDAMINRADHLLYDAKAAGRNRVVVEPTSRAGDTPPAALGER